MLQMHQKARMLINIRHRASSPILAHSFKRETAVSNPKLLQHPQINYSQPRQFVRDVAAAVATVAEIATAVTMAAAMSKNPLRSKQSHSKRSMNRQR
jgi:Tfp pilus assembly PilM family ATPase